MLSTLGLEDPPLPRGSIDAIAKAAYDELELRHPGVFSEPEIAIEGSWYRRDQHQWPSIFFCEQARHLWWILKPCWEGSWQNPSSFDRPDLKWWCWVRGDDPHFDNDYDEERKWLRQRKYGDSPSIYEPAEMLADGLLRFRKGIEPFVVLRADGSVTEAPTPVPNAIDLSLPPGAVRKLQKLADLGEIGSTLDEVARYLVIRGLENISV
jgi:hypothetical protein